MFPAQKGFVKEFNLIEEGFWDFLEFLKLTHLVPYCNFQTFLSFIPLFQLCGEFRADGLW